MKTNGIVLAISLIVFALVFSSGCLGAEQEREADLNITQAGNETVTPNIAVTEEDEHEDAQEIEPEQKEMMNLTLKIYSNFEAAELNGLRGLEIEISSISIGSEEDIIILQNQTIDLKDTKKKMTVATLEVPASEYNTARVAISSASGLFELSSSIPGILSQRQEKDLIMKSSDKTALLSQEINESAHLTIIFNIGNVTFSKPTFDNGLTGASVVSYSKCDYDCNLGCTQTVSFGSCHDSCVQSGNAVCNGNAVDLCNSQCNCPNSDCTYTKDEECRSACIKREQAEDSECKVNAVLACPDFCKEKPDYQSCMRNCNSEC